MICIFLLVGADLLNKIRPFIPLFHIHIILLIPGECRTWFILFINCYIELLKLREEYEKVMLAYTSSQRYISSCSLMELDI